MLQIRELVKLKNDPRAIEELLNDSEKEELRAIEEDIKRATICLKSYIIRQELTVTIKLLLEVSGYKVSRDKNGKYKVSWSLKEIEEEDFVIYGILTSGLDPYFKGFYTTKELAQKHQYDKDARFHSSVIKDIIVHRK